ncbi:hypothetical protein GTQ40_07750 [Flavobacteriaceae bacterium R38]|nr:hypothetical protein [Flavobacteriaceae bacterium R38]
MKLKFITLVIILFKLSLSLAQVGIGTTTPNPSSILDIFSNSKGVLFPRVSLNNSTDTSTIIGGNVESLLVYNTSSLADVTPGYYFWNGTNWSKLTDSSSALEWTLNGNSNTTAANFLGTTNDVRMEIRSNNFPLLQFGRRQTLGLTQSFPDYTDDDQPLVVINGDGNTSALQFTASAASFYRPLLFTTPNGSFRMKGSSGGTDLFEIGSSGPANDGSLEFIIGDDGQEPIVFKRYDFRNGQFNTELFRVQGSNNTADAKPRFGININPQRVAIDSDYDDSQSGFNIANSTLQIGGSLSTAIIRTTSDLTLTEDHHTVIITGNHDITLPAANTVTGRIYVIKNITATTVNITQYVRNNSGTDNRIFAQRVFVFQSDGVEWQQINRD